MGLQRAAGVEVECTEACEQAFRLLEVKSGGRG
jgi:hypothetical protein